MIALPEIHKRLSIFNEFKTFAMRGNVIDLAVGIIIGAAFTGIVNSLVSDILMPPLGLVIGGIDFSDFFVVLKGSHADTLAAAKAAGDVTLNYGMFLNSCIRFVIVAFSVFMLVRWMNRLFTTAPIEAPPTRSELLLQDIRDSLKSRTGESVDTPNSP